MAAGTSYASKMTDMDIKKKKIVFKTKVNDLEVIEQKIRALDPDFKWDEFQKDTYYDAVQGTLKIRETDFVSEIMYDESAPSATYTSSDYITCRCMDVAKQKAILLSQFGIKSIIKKRRKTYFFENLSFHFDKVEDLGDYIKIVVMQEYDPYGGPIHTIDELIEKGELFIAFLGIKLQIGPALPYHDLRIKQNEK
jgi:adenylate cyclase class IV